MIESVVKKYYRDKGYGYIRNGQHRDIMVRADDLVNCKFLMTGAKVSFECHIDGDKLVARKVKRIAAKGKRQNPPVNFVMT